MFFVDKTVYLLVVSFFLLSCTVVKHDDQAKKKEGEVTFYFESESFDAAAYVQENWDLKIIPEIRNKAIELPVIIQGLKDDAEKTKQTYGIRKEETSPYTFIVKGQFRVDSINRESSAGLLYLDLEDMTGKALCAVQIGPVIKKSMIRDSLSFINFGDFSNQIEFANISRELNFYVRDNIVKKIDNTWKSGMTVEIYGAFTMSSNGSVLLTPVILEPVDE